MESSHVLGRGQLAPRMRLIPLPAAYSFAVIMSWSTSEGNLISEFVCVYNASIAKELQPDPSWLQQNPDFR